MGERLKADLTRIGQVSRQVQQIAGEFDASTRIVQGYAGCIGSAQLSGTLNSFATDWSIHRQRLLDDLKKESSLADTAVKSYQGTDADLAAALRKAAG
jgi:hypothetical protein